MMTFSISTILLVAFLYGLVLYTVAWAADKGLVPQRVLNHPIVYVLSLTLIVNTWAFYTSFVSADARGFGYNAYYIGFGASFLLAPVLLKPILRISKTYRLSSLPDLLSFRFRSQWAGILSTIVLLLCTFPLITLQIYAVAAGTHFITGTSHDQTVGLIYCIVLTGFALRFGTRDVTGRERNDSIVMALAFEAVIKAIVLIIAGLIAVYAVFGGFGDMQEWVNSQPPEITGIDEPFLHNSTNILILLFFAAAIAMPHMFHMIFHENRNPSHLATASWGVPLYLLLTSIPTLPILWTRHVLDIDTPVRFTPLAMGFLSNNSWLTLLIYTGGLAAASGMVIVLVSSVSTICLNHLILPIKNPPQNINLYKWLLRRKRLLVIALMACSYFWYLPVSDAYRILSNGFITFIACVQLLPGIVTMLYWPPANSKGFVAGIVTGLIIWFVMGFAPLLFNIVIFDISMKNGDVINWNLIASISMLANLCTLVVVSLLTKTSQEEKRAARMCFMDSVADPYQRPLSVDSPAGFIACLSIPLGIETARQEVFQALKDLGMDESEHRPYHLQWLRAQTEANLSSLLGTTIAQQIMERFLPFSTPSTTDKSPNISFIEHQLESWPGNLSGIALDLDVLRRHHRQVLLNMPLAVCSIDAQFQINLWNKAMHQLTGLAAGSVLGMPLDSLPKPWSCLLHNFISDHQTTHIHRHKLTVDGRQRSLNLHKAAMPTSAPDATNEAASLSNLLPTSAIGAEQIILIEDQTETTNLEAELAHAERLSSIGRLAAGVAHEIGNPVTGIACIAQNMRDETSDSEQREMAEQIIQQTRRISSIMHSLVTFSHSGQQAGHPSKPEIVSIRLVVAEAIKLSQLQQDGQNVRYTNLCDKHTCLNTDRQRLLQVLINLLSNARDASEDGSEVIVTNSSNSRESQLMVTDSGCGIPIDHAERVFDPFFTTKDPGKGTGLGLSLVYRIMSDLGGSISIEDQSTKMGEKGTRVIVTFPCYDPQPEAVSH